ncbi:MAG: protein-export chaperone SecB [Thermodesulfobacteriota bacterium]
MMSEPNEQAKPPEAPVFRLQKLYLKDFSFENPNAPEVFLQRNEPRVEVNLATKHRRVDNDNWEVTLEVNAKVTSGDKTLFLVEVEHAGLFLLKNIPDQHMPPVLAVECPTVMFPFTRQIISQATVDGGFVPLMLEPVNFLALYENARRQQQQQQQGPPPQAH